MRELGLKGSNTVLPVANIGRYSNQVSAAYVGRLIGDTNYSVEFNYCDSVKGTGFKLALKKKAREMRLEIC